MRNQLDKAIRRVTAARHAEQRRAAVLVIPALLTILFVNWQLHQVGTAMTDNEYSCGYEEHVHSDACYTEVLICGYEEEAPEPPADLAEDEAPPADPAEDEAPEPPADSAEDEAPPADSAEDEAPESPADSAEEEEEEDGDAAPAGHSHTADCYQKVLTCTVPEHTHTLECLADLTADVESPADWDGQSAGVSSFWSDAMTEIAQRQLGYTESARNFTVDMAMGEAPAQTHHYTRYGDWYGNPYGNWDVMFVAFCQHYAGIPENVIPQCASLLQLRTELGNTHPEYITPGGSEAVPGDIVIYRNTNGGETIGIVIAYDGANLTVVSGAVNGAVATVTVADTAAADTIRVLDAYRAYTQTGAPDESAPDESAPAESAPDESAPDESESNEPAPDESESNEPAPDESESNEPAPDGSEEFSLDADAILARDGAVAYIVWQQPDSIMLAAEGDDTPAASSGYDSSGNLKLDNLLTSTDISINQNGKWTPLEESSQIKDGTEVQVGILYSVPANAFKNGQYTATYTLPKGVYPKSDLTGDITDSSGKKIGTFTLTENSPTVTFYFDANVTNHAFDGTFDFTTMINYAETSGTGKIQLGTKTYTIVPEYSLKAEKTHTLSADKKKVSYTVTVNAPNGTDKQTVTITDQMAAENTASGSYDKDSIKIDGKPLSEYTGATITYNTDGKGFTITGLPALGYNQSYTLTYDVAVDAVTGEDGSGTLVNTAKSTADTLQSNEAKDTVTVQESSISKTGSYDAAAHRINWVITVKNPGGNLAGYTVTDTPNPSLDIVGDVTLKSSDGAVDTTIKGREFLIGGYTFPENSTADSYTFTYQTLAPDPENGIVSATNQATLKRDEFLYTATAVVSTGVGKVYIQKDLGTVTPLANGDQQVMWNITGTVPAGVNSFKIVDNIRKPLYGVRSQLETAIQNSLCLTMEDGTTLTWDQAVAQGIQIQLSFFSNGSNDWDDPDDGNPVSDNATEVHRIRLQFDRTGGKKLRILRCTISDIPTVAKTSDMANNTTQNFVNRAEIHSDNAGSEGWNGIYKYTKGSITKEASSSSGDGYQQNNNTTYAKNKVIWYRIKLNLGDSVDNTQTLTVVDKIPDGMKLATDGNFLKDYMIAVDLDANSGNKYTGQIYERDANIYSLMFGSDTYWSIDTSVPKQLTIRVLPPTLKSLIVQDKKTDHIVEIRYALRLDDAAWDERGREGKTYTNTATWNGASISSSMTITRPKKKPLEKTGSYDETTHQANYTLYVNPQAEDLAPGSDTLELTDTMQSEYFGKTGMELMLDSIKVYEYRLKNGEWVKGEEVTDGVRVEKLEETPSTRQYKFILPDAKALVLEYSYKMNPGDLASDKEVTNTAALEGETAVNNQVAVKRDSASATVNNAVLTVTKTDSATNVAITASSAAFELHHYNRTVGKWEPLGMRRTGTNGSFDLTFAQSPAAGSAQLITGDLYRLVETESPKGYALNGTPHYFIWNDNATDDAKKAEALADAAGSPAPDELTTKDIHFLGVNGNRGTMAIPNTQNILTLHKIWYGLQNDTIDAPVDEIQVQLYRYPADKIKASAKPVGDPITLTKKNGWTEKITLEDGYFYYVEELGTDTGALIFYEVNYSENNETGVIGGGTITITNKQKPSYELPSTGGIGTTLFYVIGGGLMAVAAVLLVTKKRMNNK